ncbi:shikimate dehydrogenase [Candidatus Woesearchaeota archaeon]|nr:shikimate dehydrogenase [Candidatus Woesearchaeota archaeon]
MICRSVVASSIDEIIKILSNENCADLAEIRLDGIKKIPENGISKISSKKRLPIIFTCRKKKDGGIFSRKEKNRIELLQECIARGADYVDIEMSSGKKAIDRILSGKGRTKIIISYHNFSGVPKNIHSIYEEMKSLGGDIIKIACMARSISDNLIMLDIIKKARKEGVRIIALCMGEKGEISRILNLAYGAYLTFGSVATGKETSPGQIPCEELKRIYRADKLKIKNLKIYGLVGNPVSKSKGFIVHNYLFKKHNLNAVYLNFHVDNLGEFVKSFRSMLSGFSVTMPYKEEITSYLDSTHEDSMKIGAVNTVLVDGENMRGYNTDAYGAISAIEDKISIKGKSTILIGAGGAARAIGYGIKLKGGKITITSRTEEKARRLAKKLNCKFTSLSKINWDDVEILINSTPVGMHPNINKSPVEKKHLKGITVFDAIYNPMETKLLKMAKQNGCVTISGARMFAYQAAMQFELWTGIRHQEGVIEKVLYGQ